MDLIPPAEWFGPLQKGGSGVVAGHGGGDEVWLGAVPKGYHWVNFCYQNVDTLERDDTHEYFIQIKKTYPIWFELFPEHIIGYTP